MPVRALACARALVVTLRETPTRSQDTQCNLLSALPQHEGFGMERIVHARRQPLVEIPSQPEANRWCDINFRRPDAEGLPGRGLRLGMPAAQESKDAENQGGEQTSRKGFHELSTKRWKSCNPRSSQ